MTDVLIRNVPAETVKALKRRAQAHNRSLQGELMEVLIEVATREVKPNGAALAREVRERIEEERGGAFSDDSADIVRADRDSR